MKTLLNISKYLTAIGTVATMVWGGYKIYDTIVETKEMVEYVNIEQSMISKDILSIHDTLQAMNENIQKNAALSEKLIWLEKNRKQFTPDQIDIILDEFIKKKYDWTPYGWIPSVISIDDTLENTTYSLYPLTNKP